MYFNKKYDRTGSLFQGSYRALMVNDDIYLLHLSRYNHQNPLEFNKDLTIGHTSYPEYLGLRKNDWEKPDINLEYFNKPTFPEFIKVNNYKAFVENTNADSSEILGNLTLE